MVFGVIIKITSWCSSSSIIIILIMIILNTVINVITRPKLAYGRQGLAGVTLCASGAQLKVNKNVTDIHFIMIYIL